MANRRSLDEWCRQHERQRDETAPRQKTQADMDRFLRKQAEEMGMQDFDPSAEEIRWENARERKEEKRAAELNSFSGIRELIASQASQFASAPDAGGAVFPRLELKRVSQAVELEQYGSEHLKAELTRLGLKVGGSLQQKAERLFLTKNVVNIEADLHPKHLFKRAVGPDEDELRATTKKRKLPVQGPLLDGLERRSGQLSLPGKKKPSFHPAGPQLNAQLKRDNLGPIF